MPHLLNVLEIYVTRPKPPHGRQGLGWDSRAGFSLGFRIFQIICLPNITFLYPNITTLAGGAGISKNVTDIHFFVIYRGSQLTWGRGAGWGGNEQKHHRHKLFCHSQGVSTDRERGQGIPHICQFVTPPHYLGQ